MTNLTIPIQPLPPAASPASDPPLTPAQRASLRAAAALVIPASAEFGIPGADDPAILADIERTLGRDREPVLAALALLDTAAGGPLADQPPERQRAAAKWLRAHHRGLADTLAIQVVACYYRDDRVMRSLGLEPRAPFPQGYEAPAGDLGLLEPVRQRGRIWREA